jgi:hypothetical protein
MRDRTNMPDNEPEKRKVKSVGTVPVLGYAERHEDTPSREFIMEEHPDGVSFVKAMPARPYMAMALVVSASLALIVGLLAIWVFVLHGSPDFGPPLPRFMAPIPFLAVSAALLYSLRMTRSRTLSLSVRGGDLILLNGPGQLLPSWVLRSPQAFVVSTAPAHLLMGRMLADLRVVNRFGRTRAVLPNIPKIECKRLAEVLNRHLNPSAG